MSRRVALLVTAAALLGLIAVVSGPVGAQIGPPPNVPQQFPGTADFHGYASGVGVHADALQAAAAGPQVLTVDEAFSGATVASQGLNNITYTDGTGVHSIGKTQQGVSAATNEMGNTVQPSPLPNTDPNLPGDRSFARGSGLELGAGNNVPDPNGQLALQKARVSAPPPPNPNPIVKEVGPIKGSPLLFASLLRGTAGANWNNNQCVLGQPLSDGQGYAADAQLLNSGAALPTGKLATPVLATDTSTQNVAQSRSFTQLVAPTDVNNNPLPNPGGAALTAETHQILAPVTLGEGTPAQVTIDVGGEWVLRATAGGVPGSAHVDFFPGATRPTAGVEVPVLRILMPNAANPADRVLKILNLGDLFGNGRLPIPLINVPGVANITVGENPRAIGQDAAAHPAGAYAAADGTAASGAVDVVRVQLLDNPAMGLHAADIRIGHMEASANVPAGGVGCRAGIAKTSDPQAVRAGGTFTYNLDVSNPFTNCTLMNVRVTDTISSSNNINHTIVSTSPTASTVSPPGTASGPTRTVVWNDVGPLAPNSSRRLTIVVRVDTNAPSGTFSDTMIREGVCNGVPLGREAITVNVPMVQGNTPVPPPVTFRPSQYIPPSLLPRPVLRPTTIVPPVAPPAVPAVLRTDIVRPVLPFTGSRPLPLLATAVLFLAFGGWLMLSSRRFNVGLAYAGVDGSSGPAGPVDGAVLFQAAAEDDERRRDWFSGGGGGVATVDEDDETAWLNDLGLDLDNLDIDALFDATLPESAPPPAAPHVPVAPSWPTAIPETSALVEPPVAAEPQWAEPQWADAPVDATPRAFVVDSTGTVSPEAVVPVELFSPPPAAELVAEPDAEPIVEPEPVAAPLDHDALALHVALRWDLPAPAATPTVAQGAPPATIAPAPAPSAWYSAAAPVPSLESVLPAVHEHHEHHDHDVSRPVAGLPNLRHAMFIGGAALALGAIKIVADHHRRRH